MKFRGDQDCSEGNGEGRWQRKKECYLCGGKLRGGYCPDCGLDNTRIQRKHYHLNESYAVESMNGDNRKASVKCKVKTRQEDRKESSFHTEKEKKDLSQKGKNKHQDQNRYQFQNMKTARNAGRTMSHGIPSSGKVKIAVAVVGLAVVAIGLIADYTGGWSPDFTGRVVYESEAENVYDPYEYVEKELAKTGEHFEVELKQGDYLVGVHLPEGVYTAELLYGTGGLSVDDYENGIYLWQSFGPEEEYDEVEFMDDIRLYAGAHLQIRDAACLQLTTENGQTVEMEGIVNPLTEVITLRKDQVMMVGEDISPGVYDLSVMFNWAILRCKIPDDAYEEGYYEKAYWLSGEDGTDIYRNVYLKEGVEITAEENTLELTPSPVIGSGDYDEYYQYY